MYTYHRSVLLDETVKGLQVKKDGVYLDGTVGGGGHSSEILKSLENGLLVGVDKDLDALEYANKRLKSEGKNFVLAKLDFKNFEVILDKLEIDKIDGAVFDLGVSSHQLDDGNRGFSFQKDARLDMRMDQEQNLDAEFVINHYSQEQLETVLKEYGQERYAKRVAREIVESRPLKTTTELAELVKKCVPFSSKENKHPATRTFQAIRVEVNEELKGLEKTLESLVTRVRPGGRIAVITFHSLEDTIIKKTFSKMEAPCQCPPEFPVCVCDKKPLVKRVNRKPITATSQEVDENPRSRSAKLRIIEVL